MKNPPKHPDKPCPYLSGSYFCDYGKWIKKPKCHKIKDVTQCPKYRIWKQRMDNYLIKEKNAPESVVSRFSAILGKWI